MTLFVATVVQIVSFNRPLPFAVYKANIERS